MTLLWTRSHRADSEARVLADRHYNRQKPGTPQFVPPGRCLVLKAKTNDGAAFWVTSWPFAEYVKHAWAGAWVCSAFRNENAAKASDLIKEAVIWSQEYWGETPELGMITFINRKYVKPIKIRGVDTWGYSYKKAGFKEVGETKGALLALQLAIGDMP